MAFPSDLARTKNWGTEILTDSDLETQLDLIINWVMAALDATNGHDHSGTSNKSKKIPLASGVSGQLAVANATDVLKAVYPVGIVITLGVSTNPATLFGFGTWTAIAGKVIVGLNGAETEFDTLDETGGAKTVTLDVTQIPPHTHTIQTYSEDGTPDIYVGGDSSSIPVATPSTSSVGGGLSHNNLQPYIVKYVWQRTV
jgi:hypothetical protein